MKNFIAELNLIAQHLEPCVKDHKDDDRLAEAHAELLDLIERMSEA